MEFAEKNLPDDKKIFLICTYGGSANYKSIEQILDKKHASVVGKFGCKGYDTFGPFKLVGGIAKGHPNRYKDFSERGKGISIIWTCGLWRLWGNDDQTGCSGRRKVLDKEGYMEELEKTTSRILEITLQIAELENEIAVAKKKCDEATEKEMEVNEIAALQDFDKIQLSKIIEKVFIYEPGRMEISWKMDDIFYKEEKA